MKEYKTMKLEITEEETIWIKESCGSFDCALRCRKTGKYIAFTESENGLREYMEGELFDTPEQAVAAASHFFS